MESVAVLLLSLMCSLSTPVDGTNRLLASSEHLLWERKGGWLIAGNNSLQSDPIALFYQPSDDTLLAVMQRQIEKLNATDGSTISFFETPVPLGTILSENFPAVHMNNAGAIEYLYSNGAMIDVVSEALLWNDTNLPWPTLFGSNRAFFSTDGSTLYVYERPNPFKPELQLWAVNAADGNIAWQRVNSTFGDPTFYQGSIYASDANFTAGLYKVDPATGEDTLLWRAPDQTDYFFLGATQPPVVAGNKLFLLDSEYHLLGFNLDSLANGPEFTSAYFFDILHPLTANEDTVFGFSDEFLSKDLVRAIKADDGSLLWTALDGSRSAVDENGEEIDNEPRIIQIGPVSGNVYVIRDNGIFILDPATGTVLAEIGFSPETIYYPNKVIFNDVETVLFLTEDGDETLVRAYSLENIRSDRPPAPAPTPASDSSRVGSMCTGAFVVIVGLLGFW